MTDLPYDRFNRFKRPPINTWPYETRLQFPEGLHGFERHNRFNLVGRQSEIPFLWLESMENDAISFVVIDPFPLCPTYHPLVSKADLCDLGVEDEAKLILLAVVNPKEKPYTVNLAAPLLVNWKKRIGKQILISEDPTYPIPSTTL